MRISRQAFVGVTAVAGQDACIHRPLRGPCTSPHRVLRHPQPHANPQEARSAGRSSSSSGAGRARYRGAAREPPPSTSGFPRGTCASAASSATCDRARTVAPSPHAPGHLLRTPAAKRSPGAICCHKAALRESRIVGAHIPEDMAVNLVAPHGLGANASNVRTCKNHTTNPRLARADLGVHPYRRSYRFCGPTRARRLPTHPSCQRALRPRQRLLFGLSQTAWSA